MRIFVKTIDPDGLTVDENVGFVGLRALLQHRNPLVGLSVEANDVGDAYATHYLYTLEEDQDGEYIKRHPLRRLTRTVTAIKHYDCARTITDCFAASNNTDVRAPVIPKNAGNYFFSEDEKNNLLLSVCTCFLIDDVHVFKNQDRLLIQSIFTTLLSAGFITHLGWQDNLELLSINEKKLKEIASALFALHEVGFLNQTIFMAVVCHENPWTYASALRELTHLHLRKTMKGETQVHAVDFTETRNPDDNLFRGITAERRINSNHCVNCITDHPYPLNVSKIIAMLYHRFEKEFDTKMINAIASIKDQAHLNDLRGILLCMHKSKILNKKNSLRLLKENPLRYQLIYFFMRRQLNLGSKLPLNQALFECIIAFDGDPQVLVSKLVKRYDPAASVALFTKLANANIGTANNLDFFCNHTNTQTLDRLINEVITANVTITQTIFHVFCIHPKPHDKSAVEILVSTLVGRNELRNYLVRASEHQSIRASEHQKSLHLVV